MAVDFDGTIVTLGARPEIGRDNGAVPYLRVLAARGHAVLLWTARGGADLEDALRWCVEMGVPLSGVMSSKGPFDVLVDDLALGCPLLIDSDGKPAVDWAVVGPRLLEMLP